MSENKEFWLVERVDQEGNIYYSKLFPSKEEAREVYMALIEHNTDGNDLISMTKSKAKLLTE